MNIIKTSEKILVWMHRKKITGQMIAEKLGTTRQSVSQKLKDNSFSSGDISILYFMGYKEE